MPRTHSIRVLRMAFAALGLASTALAQDAAGPAQPDPTAFTVFVRASPVGSEQVSVARTAGGWVIAATGRTGVPPNIVTRRLQLQYDAEWRPLGLTLATTGPGDASELQTTVDGSSATSRVMEGGSSTERTDMIDPSSLLLPNPLLASYAALAARLQTAAAGTRIPAYVAPQGSVALEVREVGTERIQTLGRVIEARRARLTMHSQGAPLDLEVWGDEAGRLLRVSVPSQALEFMREDVASVSTRRVVVARDNDETVWVPGNGFSLAGTLSKPGGPPAGGQRPAIVLAGGSGPTDRDEIVAGIPIFGQLAGALADAGFLVLRYDRRGVGQSGGRAESATIEDYADDLRGAVRFMSDRREVDRNRLFVLGYGEGGAVAMIAASRENRVRGLVLVAAMGTSGADLNIAQVTRALERSNRLPAERQATIALQKRIQDAVLADGSWEGIPDTFRQQADTPWFRSFLAFDPARVMRNIDQPILIVHGLLDTQIDPSNADRLETLAQARGRNRSVHAVRVPQVNHLLVAAQTGEIDEYASLRDQAISPDVAGAVAGWMQKTFPGRR